jgi:hypothetical protein
MTVIEVRHRSSVNLSSKFVIKVQSAEFPPKKSYKKSDFLLDRMEKLPYNIHKQSGIADNISTVYESCSETTVSERLPPDGAVLQDNGLEKPRPLAKHCTKLQ